MSDFVMIVNAMGLMPYIVGTILAYVAIALFERFVNRA